MTEGMSNLMDPVGWVAAKLEWLTLWLLCREPASGLLSKDDVRRQVGWGPRHLVWAMKGRTHRGRPGVRLACACCLLQENQWQSG